MLATTVRGSRCMVACVGLPQTGETHISCRYWWGLTCTWPIAPASLARSATAGEAIPSTSTIFPRTSFAANASGAPVCRYTIFPRTPSGAEEREKEWVMQAIRPRGASIPAGPGRLIYASCMIRAVR